MITIQKVIPEQAEQLLAFSRETFYEFFAHLNTPENMESYSAVSFTPARISEELANNESEFYFALDGSEIAGYIKINAGQAQNEFKNDNCLEIERIYVSGKHHGKKIGKLLLNHAVDITVDNQYDFIWLGVWEHNHSAIGFYEHSGFTFVGSHDFFLGNDRQTDLLMKKIL